MPRNTASERQRLQWAACVYVLSSPQVPTVDDILNVPSPVRDPVSVAPGHQGAEASSRQPSLSIPLRARRMSLDTDAPAFSHRDTSGLVAPGEYRSTTARS